MFELRRVVQLAEEVGGMTAAKRMLAEAGVPIMDGLYNHGALEAVKLEPATTNIGSANKAMWTLAENDGLGAVKRLMDRLDLDITHHQYHHTNWIVLRNAEGRRQQVKMYCSARSTRRNGAVYFGVSGFLGEGPPLYLFMCYQGPMAWVMTRRDLMSLHRKCWENNGILPDGGAGFSIPPSEYELGRGYLSCRFLPDDPYRLLNRGQLGL